MDKDFFDKRNYRVNFTKIKYFGIKKSISLKRGIKEIIKYLKKNKEINHNNRIFYNHK